jgi:microcystin-dependent protein
MRFNYKFPAFLFVLLICRTIGYSQQSVGIGTATPDSKAALDISSTQKGVLFPALTTAQMATLSGMLSAAEAGMLVTDAATGALKSWNGGAWQNFTPTNTLTAKAPLAVASNNIKLNPGTAVGDLITWDGNNWVNKQPVPQHFSLQADNRQPYLAINFCISMFGIFPSQNDAAQPYVGEIFSLACNFAPVGWAFCNGQLLSIAQNEVLFQLIGTTYGGDGQQTFALPDLRGRVAVAQGNNGTSNYIIGQSGGAETKTFAH